MSFRPGSRCFRSRGELEIAGSGVFYSQVSTPCYAHGGAVLFGLYVDQIQTDDLDEDVSKGHAGAAAGLQLPLQSSIY
jgi:hypothetical protein